MSRLQQLKEDFLYDLLPDGIIDLDTQGLIQAVVGGFCDRVDDIRTYVSLFEALVTGNGLPETDNSGNPTNNVVLCQVQGPQGNVYNRSLNFDDNTPANGTPALLAWAANLLLLDENHTLLSAAYGVDMLRLVDANILSYLASTIGAVLYQTAAMDPDNAQSDARRLIQTWFPRLQYKGTAKSFETLGRLLGFDDVRMTPLFGRLSPRIANDIGDPQNNPDFAVTPDYFPKQARDNFYDPWVLNDGPFFTWTGTCSALLGTNATSFYTEVVNGFNPFIAVEIVGTAPTDPDPTLSPYILTGGGPETPASVLTNSGLLFTAITAGSSFNGLPIDVQSIDNGTYTLLSVTGQLSAIKYRTSFYDLALTLDFDHALQQFGTDIASPNSDLSTTPTLANFGSVALSPYRPWQAGSITQPLIVADWLTRTNTTGNMAIVVQRTQADLTSREYPMDLIAAAGAQVVQAMEEVRPATRSPRQINTGFLINDQIGYASYCAAQNLFTTSASTGTYVGTLAGFPLPPYNAEFLAYTSAGTVPLVGETDLNNSGFIRFTALDLSISGTYSYADSSWLFAFVGVNTGTTVVVSYAPTSTEVLRTGPGQGCMLSAYQSRPEDTIDCPDYTMADEYPWRRDPVGGGELVDFNTYCPALPDIQTVNLDLATSVFSQTGAEYDVRVAVPGPYPPRFVLSERCLDNYVPGQRAIAYTGTFLDLAGPRPSVGTLEGGLDGVMQPGWQLYHFGVVQGVLVADPVKFFGVHHRVGLALWYPFNEQPLDPLQVADHSIYANNPAASGINPSNRSFDPVRGNYLAAQPGLSLTSPNYCGFNQAFSGGVWMQSAAVYSTEQTILNSGPLQLTLSNVVTGPQLNFYLNQPGGTPALQISQPFGPLWTYFAWNFDGNNQLTSYYWNGYGILTTQNVTVTTPIDFITPYSFSLTCPLAPFNIQDLRLWNTTKQQADLTLSRYHSPTPTACLYRPSWLQSVNTYDQYAVRVLPSGFLVPDQLPTSIITDQLAWVQRYDYFGRYEAQPRYKETGLGSGNIPTAVQPLGAQWDTLTADGTLVVSTTAGGPIGINTPWLLDNPTGQVLTLYETGSTISGITGTLISTGTSSPWPNPVPWMNPCVDQVWIEGDDNFLWQVTLGSVQSGTVAFETQKLFSLSGSYQPTGAHANIVNGTNRLAVSASGQVYAGLYTQAPIHSSPLYLYSNEITPVNLAGTNVTNAWIDPNLLGLGQNPPVAALTGNGQIAFQLSQALVPGFYRLQVTSGNIGQVDSSFAGFNTVVTVGDVPFQMVLCAGQTGANFSQTDTYEFYLNHTLPGSPSSWLLTFDWSNALNDPQRGTTRQLFISGVNLTLYQSTLYQVSVSTGAVQMTALNTTSAGFPTTPGGWLAIMNSWGTVVSYAHESTVYSSNDTLQNPQPLSNKLGATSVYRSEDLVLTGSFTILDTASPPFVSFGSLTHTGT